MNSKEISNVFYTTPRDGYKEGILWIARPEERELTSRLDSMGVSVCIDGPTGTGKSSLAITVLKKKKINFLLLQVTKNMTWSTFCKKLFESKVNDNTYDIGLDAGIEKGLPIFKLHFGWKSEEHHKVGTDFFSQLTDHDICSLLVERNITLVIDDFERASDDILSNVGEMCKLLTLTYLSDHVKLIIIGTDDIYMRLISFNKSLEARLKEISLGTIERKQESWNFLMRGFDKLRLKHPLQELQKGYPSVTAKDIEEIQEACYDAANGLLKSVNELGSEIARNATSQDRISKSTIMNVAKTYLEKNIRQFTNEYPRIANAVQNNSLLKDVVVYLYRHGIGRIHRWSEIYDQLESSAEEKQIEHAICELVDIGFMTRTGYNGEILFVTNATFAHTLATIINNPTKYRAPKSLKGTNGQYVLPFLTKSQQAP